MNQTMSTELEEYAQLTQTPIITSQAECDPKDKPMVAMHAWCAKQGNIVVLNSGLILTSAPTSRVVQNCKIVMLNKGLVPGKVAPAAPSLIATFLANSHSSARMETLDAEAVSEQQQRLRQLVREARVAHASDIHLEVREDITRIRFRKHGELYLHAEWIAKMGRELAAVAFNKETDHAVKHFNPNVPQSASMSLRIDGRDIRLRLASMPAHGGFDVVMRVLATRDEAVLSLEKLGYNPRQIELLNKAIRMPHGAVLISGPTGSGKTTTVASCVQQIPEHRKVFTIEDPVEKVLESITQVPVNTEHDDRGFASMGRAVLRMDPDVMVLGEMRDEQTAQVMLRAAITGHLVFSTLHTNSATGIVSRLVDMGLSPVLLADSNVLVSLICQRLVPLLCQHCAQPIQDSMLHKPHLIRWLKVFGSRLDNIKVRGHDCHHCQGTGLAGRTVIAEIIWIDDKSREFIQQVNTIAWEAHLREHGWESHQQQATDLVAQGICDPLDVENVIGEISRRQDGGVYHY